MQTFSTFSRSRMNPGIWPLTGPNKISCSSPKVCVSWRLYPSHFSTSKLSDTIFSAGFANMQNQKDGKLSLTL